MLEKGLHAGNLAAGFALIATAADLTLAGGATTVFGTALSGTALFKSADRPTRKEAKAIAADLDQAMGTAHLSPDQKKWLRQMIACFPPEEADFAKADMDGAKLTQLILTRIKKTASDVAHQSNAALTGYERVMPTVFGKAIERTIATNATQSEMIRELLDRSSKSGERDRLRDEGITEKAIIRLARRVASETDDVGQAWLELQNAMDIAVQVQADGGIRSNHGDFVDTVMQRVAELAQDGDYGAASAEIDSALAQADAQVSRLLDNGVRIALLDGDTARAAALLIRKAHLGAGGVAGFEQLRSLEDHYYELGRDRGSNLDSALAIDLCRLILPLAADQDQRGKALNDLGVALSVLGERESGTARLEEAVTAYRNVLLERSRDRVPLGWAATQNNIGNALRALGERESGTARLEEAVTAYRDALLERTRDRVPLEWAATQNNLGNALRALGERESDTARLEDAVTAYRDALLEYTRDRVPLDWAMTQNNLGTALKTLGERESGTARLEQAVTAYRDALLERTRDRLPLGWAMTQNNLGNALSVLGKRESGTARLQEAVTAYRDALLERTRDRVPLDWAMTQNNLANVELAFFDKSKEPKHLGAAEGYISGALEIFEQAKATQYIRMAEQIRSKIEARRKAI